MKLDAAKSIRQFLLHVLTKGFQCIRHHGVLATGMRVEVIALERNLLDAAKPRGDARANTSSAVDALAQTTKRLQAAFRHVPAAVDGVASSNGSSAGRRSIGHRHFGSSRTALVPRSLMSAFSL